MTQVLRWTPEQLAAYQRRQGKATQKPQERAPASEAPSGRSGAFDDAYAELREQHEKFLPAVTAAVASLSRVDFTLPWPPSINHYWRSNRGVTHISTEGKMYRKDVAAILAGTKPLLGRISVAVEAFPPDRRRRDIDNLCKALLDALQHAGCYEDDSQIDRLSVVRMERREGGAVRVVVKEIAE